MTLDDVKPGDKLAVSGVYGPPRQLSVESVTKSQIMTTDGSRWLKRGGHRVGERSGTFLRPYVQPWSEQHEKRLAKARHRDACCAAKDRLHDRAAEAVNAGRLDALKRALAALEQEEQP